MFFTITPAVRALFPELRIGLVAAQNINNAYSPEILAFVKEKFADFQRQYADEEDSFFSHKNILAWHEAYRKFGINPKKKKMSSEALLSRTLQKGFVPHINAAVDLYLACETIAFFPLGGFDLDKVSGSIRLDVSNGGEPFVGVGETEPKLTEAGEIVYADDARVLTRSFNYRDCDATKIDETTKKCALFVEAPSYAVTDEEIKETCAAIASAFEKYLGAKTQILFFDKQTEKILALV